MLFMVIEKFKNNDGAAVYERFRKKGRMLPEGLQYVESWTTADFGRCFQLMECADETLFGLWVEQWQDLVDFEIIPVLRSKEAAEAMAHQL